MAEYCGVEPNVLRKIHATDNISLLDYVNQFYCADYSILFLHGYIGVLVFTACLGVQVIEWPKPGENVFVSAVAGAVGMFVGQLAKIKGCKVVGSTGTDEKVKLLKDEYEFDDAFNYKKEADFNAALGK
ncbi:hypothetical protein ACLOJK_029743 [Asimina triloba]